MKIKEENLNVVATGGYILKIDKANYTRDIAAQLGYSVATVQRALNGKNDVNKSTYEQIRRQAILDFDAYPVRITKIRL